jgi:hypothetical protein
VANNVPEMATAHAQNKIAFGHWRHTMPPRRIGNRQKSGDLGFTLEMSAEAMTDSTPL